MTDLNKTEQESFGKIILEDLIDESQDVDLAFIEPLAPKKSKIRKCDKKNRFKYFWKVERRFGHP